MWSVVVGMACTGSGVNHGERGDQAYLAGDFVAALAEYRMGLARSPSALLRARAAAAALNASELLAAAEEFRGLADINDDRAVEASDGLERVARAAVIAGNRSALAEALSGLLAISEGRAFGGFAQELAADLGDAPGSHEALDVLLHAAAGAPDVRQQDSLLLVYGQVLRRLDRCQEAASVLESLIRRRRNPALEEEARAGAVRCLLRLGQTQLDGGFPEQAENWYVRAATLDGGATIEGRAAYVGIGDVRLALGDYLAAQSAYEQAREGLAPGDSLYVVVQRRLNTIFDAGTVIR